MVFDMFDTEIMFYALPFIFMFVIVYGGLELANPLKNRKTSIIIALIFAAFAIMNYDVLQMIWNFMPYAMLFFIAMFFLAFILKVVKKEKKEGNQGRPNAELLVIALGLLFILLYYLSINADLAYTLNLYWLIPQWDNIIAIAGLILIILIFYYAYHYAYQKGKGQ